MKKASHGMYHVMYVIVCSGSPDESGQVGQCPS
jgi:hypothetical protein